LLSLLQAKAARGQGQGHKVIALRAKAKVTDCCPRVSSKSRTVLEDPSLWEERISQLETAKQRLEQHVLALETFKKYSEIMLSSGAARDVTNQQTVYTAELRNGRRATSLVTRATLRIHWTSVSGRSFGRWKSCWNYRWKAKG